MQASCAAFKKTDVRVSMRLKTLLFEVICASLLIITGSWLYLNSYANPGLMTAGFVLIALSLCMRAREIRGFFAVMQEIPIHTDTRSHTAERG